MKEKRIYVVSSVNLDGDRYSFTKDDIYLMSKEDFIDEAESQGYVWSSWESFMADYNLGYVPKSKESIIRIY